MEPEQMDIGFRLKIASTLFRRQMHLKPAMAYADDLTGTHGWIIGFLYCNRERELFQRDIEARFQMRRSTATKILQLMEKNGMIRRESVPQDARLKKILLTDKALKLHEDVEKSILETERQSISGLTPEELTAFIRTLDKIVANLGGDEAYPVNPHKTEAEK